MLIDKNPNFKSFIQDINGKINSPDPEKYKDNFDKVLDDAEMEKHKKEKHIK